MDILRVYGEKNGVENLIFGRLADLTGCHRTAKKTAAEHGYTITKVIRVGTIANGFRDENIMAEFLKA